MALLTEEQQNVALKALANTLGKPVADIEAILTSDKPGDVDVQVTERIRTIRSEGHNQGRGKLQSAADKKVKDLFGIDPKTLTPADATKGLTIEELLDAVKEGFTPEVDPSKLTEEQVKMHPTFRTLEGTLQTERKTHQKAVDDAKAEGLAIASKAQLTAKAIKALNDYGAVISDDPKIAAVQERMYLEQLEGITPKEVEGVTTYWKGDKRIENEKLFPVTEEELFKGLVEKTYTTKVSEQKTSSGLKQTDGTTGSDQSGQMTHFKGELPKTQDDLNKILLDKTLTREARNEARAYFDNQQKAA